MTVRTIPAEDTQAFGWRPDSAAEGYLATRDTISGLVRVPFLQGQYQLLTDSANLPTMRSDLYRSNSDGSCSGISVTIAPHASSATTVNSMRIRFVFWGKVFALRWQKGYDSGATPKDFSAVIDGVPYVVDNSYVRDFVYSQSLLAADQSLPQFASQYASGEACVVIAEDLADGPHMVELVFQGNENGSGVTQRWVIYGYAVESRVGHVPYRRLSALCKKQLLSTTPAVPDYSHPLSTSDLTLYPRGVRKIIYSNSTAGAVTVTLTLDYNAGTSIPIAVISVPANGTAEYDFGEPLAIDKQAYGSSGATVLLHSASANSAINATVLGVT